jgi:hypothetical protein
VTRARVTRSIAMAVALSLAVAPTSALFAKPSAGDEATKAEARARLEKGKKLYEEGAFEAALVEFQRAYELAPSYKILYNIGLIEQQLNDFVASLRAYERYLKEGGKDVTAARRSEVEKSIAALKQSIATVNVKVNVDDAEVSVDDQAVGKSPLAEAVLVNAGKRRIAAAKDGRSAAKVVSVAGGDTTTVTLEVPTSAPPPPPIATNTTTTSGSTTPVVDVEGTPATSRRIPWLGIAVTTVLASGAAVTGLLALSASNKLKDDRETLGTPRDTLDSDQSSVKRWSITSDVLLGATAVAAAITVVVWLKTPSDDATKTGGTTVNVGVAPNGVALAGSF